MISFMLIILSLLFSVINGDGFNYSTLPAPMEVHMTVYRGITNNLAYIGEYETPIAIRYVSIIDAVNWNCIAVYHQHALDAITEGEVRPIVTADCNDVTCNSEARVLCMAYAMTIVSINYMPESTNHAKSVINNLGLNEDFLTIDDDVTNCFDSFEDEADAVICLEDVAYANSFYPEIMASIIAYQAIDYLANDGWNADGSIGINGNECTANCRPFSDTTGYKPDPDRDDPMSTKWSPLVEHNGKGFYWQYDHVTPHIGTTAVTKTITRDALERRNAPPPNYNYTLEKQLVIQRLAALATNDTQKMLVEFFDNKLKVAHTLGLAMDDQLASSGWNLEERVLWMVGYTASEYDAVIQAWRSKVHYDLLRPTTLIKRDGTTKITTYAGPGPAKEINSADFESYIRVMPHSEYPSGSGCLCWAAKQYTDELLHARFNTSSISVTIPEPNSFIPALSSLIEPGITPREDLYITFDDIPSYGAACRESRLWGGMHFTTSVEIFWPENDPQNLPKNQKLCRNLGKTAYRYVDGLLAGESL